MNSRTRTCRVGHLGILALALTSLFFCLGSYAQNAGAATKPSVTVDGAGATFPLNAYRRWADLFEKQFGISVRYEPTSSGDGLKQIKAQAVSFSGSDLPLPPEELAKHKLIQVPMLVGGIVPVVNLPGIADKRLQLTGEVFAAILMGKVKQWNDPLIADINPQLTLPALPIHRVVNAGTSGSVYNVTKYLSSVSEVFKAEIGVSSKPQWPGSVQAVQGTDGIVSAMKARPGSIAFVSFDRVAKDNLTTVMMRNAQGFFVAASELGFREAIANSPLAKTLDDTASILNQEGALSWPITMTTYVLFSATPDNGEEASRIISFLFWCFSRGDGQIRGTGFAPLPTRLQSRLAVRFAQVQAKDKSPVHYQSSH